MKLFDWIHIDFLVIIETIFSNAIANTNFTQLLLQVAKVEQNLVVVLQHELLVLLRLIIQDTMEIDIDWAFNGSFYLADRALEDAKHIFISQHSVIHFLRAPILGQLI